MILLCFAEEDNYICGFYFWLDFFTIIAFFFDLHWVNNAIMKKLMDVVPDRWEIISNVGLTFKILSSSNKLLLMIPGAIKRKGFGLKFGLDAILNKRILTLVLLMIIAMNFFNANIFNTHGSTVHLHEVSTQVLEFSLHDHALLQENFNVLIDYYSKTDTPILEAHVLDISYTSESDKLSKLRPIEYIKIKLDETKNTHVSGNLSDQITGDNYIIFDNSKTMKVYYIMNIVQSISIFLIVVFGLFNFYRSVHKIVIDPIKKMTQKIKALSINPITALQESLDSADSEKNFSIEMSVLLNTVKKICGLLSLGFGEAGADIISSVMKETSTDLNPMIPGKKIFAIYGFCDIRNFTDTTEVLQEKVMIFVNEVAEIVHSITADFMGAANKNIGDAFLLVWKLGKKHTYINSKKEFDLINTREVNQIVDMSLIAFIKILIQIKKSYKMEKYSKDKKLNERINGYKVRLGFGLHLGYSIEGAIGSIYKIDCSYLSPNVEKAGEIQEKSKEYHTDLILSEKYVNYLSPEARKNVRCLGKMNDEKLYTIDLDLNAIENEKKVNDFEEFEDINAKLEHIKQRREMTKKKFEDAVKNKKNIWEEYAMKDSDIILARKKFVNIKKDVEE